MSAVGREWAPLAAERQRIADLVADGFSHVDIPASAITHQLLRDLAAELQAMAGAYEQAADNGAGWRRRAAAAEAEVERLRAELAVTTEQRDRAAALYHEWEAMAMESDDEIERLRAAITAAPHGPDCPARCATDGCEGRVPGPACNCWKAVALAAPDGDTP